MINCLEATVISSIIVCVLYLCTVYRTITSAGIFYAMAQCLVFPELIHKIEDFFYVSQHVFAQVATSSSYEGSWRVVTTQKNVRSISQDVKGLVFGACPVFGAHLVFISMSLPAKLWKQNCTFICNITILNSAPLITTHYKLHLPCNSFNHHLLSLGGTPSLHGRHSGQQRHNQTPAT